MENDEKQIFVNPNDNEIEPGWYVMIGQDRELSMSTNEIFSAWCWHNTLT